MDDLKSSLIEMYREVLKVSDTEKKALDLYADVCHLRDDLSDVAIEASKRATALAREARQS